MKQVTEAPLREIYEYLGEVDIGPTLPEGAGQSLKLKVLSK